MNLWLSNKFPKDYFLNSFNTALCLLYSFLLMILSEQIAIKSNNLRNTYSRISEKSIKPQSLRKRSYNISTLRLYWNAFLSWCIQQIFAGEYFSIYTKKLQNLTFKYCICLLDNFCKLDKFGTKAEHSAFPGEQHYCFVI